VYAHRTVESARAESLFSIERTQLSFDERVLDLCCGSGRHLAHLLKASHHVVGLDYSEDLLNLARDLVDEEAQLVRADMRSLPFEETFDVVMNYFTSFGYFMEHDENQGVVDNVCRALKPGGRFFIDYMNKDHVLSSIEPESHRFEQGFEIVEKRWVDDARQRINKLTQVLKDGEEIKQSSESVQLYTEKEFTDLLSCSCLKIESIHGNYDATPISPNNPRMIVIGRKL
jgi:SAM-dependent methyltransferase